jgi:signal transduction histidine kinase
MNRSELHERIGRRDHLVLSAEQAAQQLHEQSRKALAAGDLAAVGELLDRHQTQLSTLTENLRIYQAELRAQADELVESQARAQSAAARFSTLFSELPVAVLLVSDDGRVTDHNRQAARLFELRLPHASPRFLHRLVAGEDFRTRVWPSLAKGQLGQIDHVGFQGEAGRRFRGELHVTRLPGAGAPGDLICAVVDRTEELAALQALRRAHESLRTSDAFLDESARLARIGGWEMLTRPRRWHASEPLRRVLDCPDEMPLSYEAVLALCDEADRRRLDDAIERTLADGTPFELQLGMNTVPGRAMRVLALGRRETGGDGQPRVVGVMQDVSERMQALAAREAAESASRAKSLFLSRVSHELRTPLNAVIGFAQLMRHDADHGDLTVKPQRVQLIESSGRHLLALIDELLDVARIESGRLQLDLAPVPLLPMLLECRQMMLPQAAAEQLTLGEWPELPAGLTVQVDPKRLREVLLNLMSNAVKYHRPGGRIELRATVEPARVCLEVADDGPGIAADRMSQLFQPFNRLGAERTTIQGTGMGLYLCRLLVELMGGRIEIDSHEGQGTTARVQLPRA